MRTTVPTDPACSPSRSGILLRHPREAEDSALFVFATFSVALYRSHRFAAFAGMTSVRSIVLSVLLGMLTEFSSASKNG